MNWINSPRQQWILVRAVALVFLAFTTPLTAQPVKPDSSAVRYVPPPAPPTPIPTSGRQRGGSSRGNCLVANQPLVALVPSTWKNLDNQQQKRTPALSAWESVWGLTTDEYPTFWFYLPYSSAPKLPIEFVLQDERGNNVYKTALTVAQTRPSVIEISLPSTATPLQADKMYHWYFLIDCDPDAPPLLEGWVQRTAINPTLTKQLKAATPRQRAALYAANGIWYDALTTLAELRRARPEDTELFKDWLSLLQSAELDALAREPISPCCTAKKTMLQPIAN
ncbi:DUF928 domain-containing protein [Chroococcidiopsis sp. CCMEE 29]|uniref:DUF928 domain-containing protein n=1 Tax=Chroococcidiopsis sp. CCMEE 29 TaxID=155894 RepID=UPI002022038E|nr:DUF928 domain-containing protein [Chroococcidiopsis sp. CCMEE 29]